VSYTVVKLKDACDFIRGLTYSKRDEVDFSKNAVLRATNIDLATNTLNLTDIRYIDDSVQVRNDKKVKVNDILICTASGSKSHLGKVALIEDDIDMAFGGFMGVLRVKPNVNARFLFSFLKSDLFLKHVSNLGDGANINNLKFSQIEDLEIAIPSIQIQQKIVDRIESISAEVEKSLTASNTNLKNAEALFQSYLREVFQCCDGDYKEYQLGDICKIIGGGTPSKNNPKFYEGNIRWATVRDMKEDVIRETDFRINEEAVAESSTNIIPKNNVIIATRVGLGKVCIIENDTAINQDLRGVIPLKPNLIEVMYLFYWFKSIARVIIDAGRGATVHGVTLPFVKALKIKVPNLEAQQNIVSKIKAIQLNIDNINRVTNKKISELQLLKQSVLQQAFNGELIKE